MKKFFISAVGGFALYWLSMIALVIAEELLGVTAGEASQSIFTIMFGILIYKALR